MKVLAVDNNVSWAPLPNTRSWIIDDSMPPIELISSVFGFIFDNEGRLLLTKNKRGWGLPGGHIEKDEDLEAALHREVAEETNCEIEIIKSFGYQVIESTGEKPHNYQYPHPKGYIHYFLARLKKMHEFDVASDWRKETSDRELFTLDEIVNLEGPKERLTFYQAAFEEFKSLQ